MGKGVTINCLNNCGEKVRSLPSNPRKFCSSECSQEYYYPLPERGYKFPGTKLSYLWQVPSSWGRRYKVQCECGKTSVASAHNINAGRTITCGCGAKAYRATPKTKRTNVPYRKGATGYYNTWQRVNKLGWYFMDAEGTPLLVPPTTTLKKYKEQVSR